MPTPVARRARRGRLVSVFLLVFVLIGLGALYQYRVVDDDHPAMMYLLGVALVLAGLAALLNRLGRVTLAALLLVALADLPLPGAPATAVGGRLDVLHLGAFYLLVGPEIVAASVLAPWAEFPVALANSVLVFAVIALLPHTPALAEVLASNNGQQAYAGPILMQLLVCSCWSRLSPISGPRAPSAPCGGPTAPRRSSSWSAASSRALKSCRRGSSSSWPSTSSWPMATSLRAPRPCATLYCGRWGAAAIT